MVTNRPQTIAIVARALVVLAEASRGMATSDEIGEAIDVNPVVVRRLLGALRWHGLVESRPGPHGGWAIARDPARLTLGAVARAIRSSEQPADGELERALAAADEAYRRELDRVTIASLMGTLPESHS